MRHPMIVDDGSPMSGGYTGNVAGARAAAFSSEEVERARYRTVVRARWLVLEVGECSTQEVSSPWDDEAKAWGEAERRAWESFERFTVVRVICRVAVGPEDEAPAEYPANGRCVITDGRIEWVGDGTTWRRPT